MPTHRRLKSQADIDAQYSRIKNRAYQAYINFELDNYHEIENRLNKTYDKYTKNIAKNFGVGSRYQLSKQQRNQKLPHSVLAGANG